MDPTALIENACDVKFYCSMCVLHGSNLFWSAAFCVAENYFYTEVSPLDHFVVHSIHAEALISFDSLKIYIIIADFLMQSPAGKRCDERCDEIFFKTA